MKLQSFFFTAVLSSILVLVCGCAAGGMFPAANITDVQLQKNNFTIAARDVSGESQAAYIFGVTYSMGLAANTVALARVDGSGMLYKEALENLWKNYETSHGPVEGKKLALVNIRYDADALNLFFYTKAKIMIRADVVEFID